ncbi:phenol hydroxylase P4 protein [Raineyella antarctica]|uniref:Phenol hydroxylase P4 protein n=1 Tax=Raineyella antarctica TaxID=1577474 RepID=A0A1G6GET2_9ACTN|nr:phenol hydroxylase subunit P4 [Raineyella antarctica]SDB80487.1 phenol hydroxylase P4 protein [Raineyella antarctica]
MPTLALYDYTVHPSRSAQELYGDDMLVNIWQKDDNFFACPCAVRVPKAMTWQDFYQTQFLPYVSASPRTTGDETYAWHLDDAPFTPEDSKTLDELGVHHKHTLGFFKA